MAMLRRHQLVYLSDAGWSAVQAGAWDTQARQCLAHWAENRLPLVVTRQPAGQAVDRLALGLSAPACWQRRKLALQVPRSAVHFFDEFPLAPALARLLPRASRTPWRELCVALAQLGVAARVFGSHGWQLLTGLDYLHANSDIDLRLPVADIRMAGAVAELLREAPLHQPRLDGELVFPDGDAVAWREWLQWRDGRVEQVLVKRLYGVALERGESRAWCDESAIAYST